MNLLYKRVFKDKEVTVTKKVIVPGEFACKDNGCLRVDVYGQHDGGVEMSLGSAQSRVFVDQQAAKTLAAFFTDLVKILED